MKGASAKPHVHHNIVINSEGCARISVNSLAKGLLLCTELLKSFELGVLKCLVWCDRRRVYEGSCVDAHTRANRRDLPPISRPHLQPALSSVTNLTRTNGYNFLQ